MRLRTLLACAALWGAAGGLAGADPSPTAAPTVKTEPFRPVPALLGTWRDPQGHLLPPGVSPLEAVHSALTLAPDGGFTLTVEKAAGPLRQSGTYRVQGDRLTLSFPFGPVAYGFSRTGERLVLRPPGAGAEITLISAGPVAAAAFDVLRNDLPFPTFNSRLEAALAERDVPKALEFLAPRAGDLARRLDHLLRADASQQGRVIGAFAGVAAKVSTPVLLQVRTHFRARNDGDALRVFFPKGALAKAHGEPNALPSLPAEVCEAAAQVCEDALVGRFRSLPPLGACYVDPALADFPVPFSQRSASRSFRTIPRGSRLPLPEGAKVLRLFVWWKNGTDRTDVDLSATMFDADFRCVDVVSYYELKCDGGVHSGDVVDAPNGASEFVDLTLDRLRERGVRYVVMTLGGYTPQPFCDLPECFAGWMARSEAQSGEVFDPRTVQDRLDLTADTRIAIPLMADLVDRKLVWCDMALRMDPDFVNNVHANLGGIALTLYSFVRPTKPTLLDLFRLHAAARGKMADAPEAADTVFSVKSGTPFRLDEIASQYLQ